MIYTNAFGVDLSSMESIKKFTDNLSVYRLYEMSVYLSIYTV
jgi:hypothetical protein